MSDLQDILLAENISDHSFLVYNAEQFKWVNKSLEELIFVGATDLSSGKSGLVPAPGVSQSDLFLRGDGTWAAPEADHIVLTLDNLNKENHDDLIAEATESFNNISGDIVIIRDSLGNDKWQYTVYVYDDESWHALSSDYNAENVYFTEDLITTSAIGNISLTDGQATIAAAGKNLKEVFDTIFVKEKIPQITQPSLTLTFAQGKAYEVGSIITPSYSATFRPGNYEFGPETGVTVTSWEVKDSINNESTQPAASLGNILITDDLNYYITVTAHHGAGLIPQTNLKNKYSEGQIVAGSVTEVTKQMLGYRSGFYGTSTEKKDNLTSEDIRILHSSKRALVPGDVINVNIPIGSYRVMFAYPASLPEVTSIVDMNGLYSQILNSFTQTEVLVNGANDYEAINYRVYYMDFANAYNASNIFIFTIGEEEAED